MSFFRQLGLAYMASMQKRPLLTRMATTGGTAFLGDLTCQALFGSGQEEKNTWNIKRTVTVSGWATAFSGPFLHKWFSFLQRTFPIPPSANKRASLIIGVKKMVVDMAIGLPVVVGAFFAGVSALQGKSTQEIFTTMTTVFPQTIGVAWSVFPPFALLVHAFVPPVHSVLIVNFSTYLWLIFLSYKQFMSQPTLQRIEEN
mmetsp:Transcript_9952/g.15010  ORF Transcript_9952/g.15010 Transcript_9952/m.15010 type:complete len:200 (+) Transcript_9952:1382-1981(+)